MTAEEHTCLVEKQTQDDSENELLFWIPITRCPDLNSIASSLRGLLADINATSTPHRAPIASRTPCQNYIYPDNPSFHLKHCAFDPTSTLSESTQPTRAYRG